MELVARWIPLLTALIAAPLLRSVIDRTKARIAGRRGPPWLQPYRDLRKWFARGAVYSETTTWVFRVAPVVLPAAMVGALAVAPFADLPSLTDFSGDLVLFAYLLAVARFFVVIGALDTGSPFEGMGASREAWYGALVEPVLFVTLATLARETDAFSLYHLFHGLGPEKWAEAWPVLGLAVISLFAVFFVESARVPVDDPQTHLELTMIHEVMILDHSGPDLGLLEYAHMLKMWLLGTIIVGTVLPVQAGPYTGAPGWWPGAALAFGLTLAGMFALGVVVGLVESSLARMRLLKVPQFVLVAGAFAGLSLFLQIH